MALYKPGESGNLNGRPKGCKNRFTLGDLKKALDRAKEAHGGVSLIDHLCNKAYEDNAVAIAILKKMLPDLRQVEALVDVKAIGFAALTPAEACASMDATTMGKKSDV